MELMHRSLRLPVFAAALATIGVAGTWFAGVRGWIPAQVFGSTPYFAARSAPACAPGASLTFFALGDTGDDTRQRAHVVEAMAEHAEPEAPAFVVLLGDNFYPHGVDEPDSPRFARDFEAALPGDRFPMHCYVVLGNHDHEGSIEAQLAHVSPSGRWRAPSRYYAFSEVAPDGATVDFFVLDTTPLARHVAGFERQLEWLALRLGTSTADWRVVIGHHTIVSGGVHGDSAVLQVRLAPLLRDGRVDIYICGHDHDLQALQLANGPLVIVCGSGSRVRRVGHTDDSLYSESAPGFVRVRIDRERLCASLISPEGVRYEHHVTRAVGPADAPH
jgi:tartrate-resistant acid phosphatase type 5